MPGLWWVDAVRPYDYVTGPVPGGRTHLACAGPQAIPDLGERRP
jgi:hypothetical protein